MQLTTAPVLILGYGIWDIDGEPVTNKEGEPVEYVQVLDLDNDESYKWTLRGVNGERPKELKTARVVCELRTARKGLQDGRVSEKIKVGVTGFEPA
jgi:hypothetical protein